MYFGEIDLEQNNSFLKRNKMLIESYVYRIHFIHENKYINNFKYNICFS